ncbi:MAG: RNA polymerase factor sigma-54, partial [Pseudomonadota bacterium]|nr:RNA polymerase factor sigma-54 [Pseudomonadota bacterium]
MAFEAKQSLNVKISQRLQVTPQLQQAIKILQLSRFDLNEYVSEQLADNPVLDEGSDDTAERENTEEQAMQERLVKASEIVDAVSQDTPEVDWENLARMKETTSVNRHRDKPAYSYENIGARSKSLQDHLYWQISELDLTRKEQRIAALLIGNLDDSGYLACDLQELADAENMPLNELEAVLDIIQRLDPNGVGAKDLPSCLLIQLRNSDKLSPSLARIIANHLPNLVNRNFQAIAKNLATSIERVIADAEVIAKLEPIPARQFDTETTHYIVPDAYVFKSGGKWQVSLNEEGLPRLAINDHYRQMRGDCAKKERSYLETKLKSAEWLIKSIQQRQNTIYRVTHCIVAKQRDFFEKGMEHLKPMVLNDIAKELALHESTISRVSNGKYVHTPHGLLELKFFFNSSVTSSDNAGGAVASETV